MTSEEFLRDVCAREEAFKIKHGEALYRAMIPDAVQALTAPFMLHHGKNRIAWLDDCDHTIEKVLSGIGLPAAGMEAIRRLHRSGGEPRQEGD